MLTLPCALDDLPPVHRALMQRIGIIRAGEVIALQTCECCLMPFWKCEGCMGAACPRCDHCPGCGRVLCMERCNVAGAPLRPCGSFFGAHPHNAD